MFEDDIDFDEILNCCELSNTSLKRPNNDTQTEQLIKKTRISSVARIDNEINTSKSNETKKVFHFKKKEDFKKEVINNAGIFNVNNKIFSSTTSNVVESEKYEVKNNSIIENLEKCSYLTQDKNKREDKINSVPSSGNPIPKFNIESIDPASNNLDQFSKKYLPTKNTNDSSIIKRRFPGPAGLLPERNPNNSVLESMDNSSRRETKEEILSQNAYVSFNEILWNKMILDYKAQEVLLPEKYNIQWIKSRMSMKKLINQKAPFLAAFVDIIRSHSIQNPIVNLILRDKTGTIQGTILHNLYEEHSGNLTVGSVIVLRDLGVLSIGSNNEPFLAITRNNLISIYSNRKKITNSSTQTSDEITKIILQNLDPNEILNKIKETRKHHKIKLENTPKIIQNTSLLQEEIKGPSNMSDTFRKVVQNTKFSVNSRSPNLNVLRIKSSVSDNSVKVNEGGSNSPCHNENQKLKDIIGFFGTQKDIEEFFNDEPTSCSTQKESSHENVNRLETSSVDNKIFEDMLEGVDTNALFDEF
ncbi:uncharacterized protein LOC123676251 [Harmonia axyridis]|uniref:uncharacterized protein LOC123676251 n=1 Tax=Harmonia axyridis TaxID=115357 RepID=UPI001E2790A1|nr:uncharacterized protein LOC123676251 [Harmonia axyridis]